MDNKNKNATKEFKSFEEIVGLVPISHDLFCSYAHSDNQSGLVNKILKSMCETYQSLTGEQLRVFIDKAEIITADFWETKINKELSESRLLLALLSPSYFKSEWCRREWLHTERREPLINVVRRSPLVSGIIVPVLIFPLNRARLSVEEKLLVTSAKRRQWYDLTNTKPGSIKFLQMIKGLAEDIIDNLDGLRSIISEQSEPLSDVVITDSRTRLMWAAVVPSVQMSYEEANEYVAKLDIGGYIDWRLPLKEELESLLDPRLLSNSPHASPVPIRPPFNSPRYGYLISGTILGTLDRGYYVMNIRNGHIFNGLGHRCFVRAVRGLVQSSVLKDAKQSAESDDQ